MALFNSIKSAYDWYVGVYDSSGNEVLSYHEPDASGLPQKKIKKWTVTERIKSYYGTSESTYDVRLTLARKD